MKRRPVARSRGRKVPPPARPMRMARKCCVLDCDADVQEARNKGLPLHKFPKDVVLRSKWLTSGGFDTNFKPTPGQVVCYRHFKRADYESVAKGHKFSLKKGSVPSIFQDYDNHPDPVVMSVKSSTSYAQEDLDLINSEILNMSHSMSSLPGGSSKMLLADKSNETNNSESKSLTNTSDMLNLTIPIDNGYKLVNTKREYTNPTKQVAEVNMEAKTVDSIGEKVENMAMQLGIVEQHVTMEDIANNVITKDEPKDTKVLESRNADKGELRSKLINRGGLKFFPGAKLEAKDFNEKWYSAKVVETDWVEQEVLIHFDKWSSRFDEWIPMDSSRLRVLQAQPTEQIWEPPSPETKVREFSVGERILATWVDGRKYPAKINAVLGNDRYDVLFDDGYAKIIRSSKMTKIATRPIKHLPGQGEEYIGSKQERRDKKRKHTVMELFNTHSRRRSKNEMDKSTKKEVTAMEAEDYCLETKVDLDGTLFGACYDPGTDLLRGFDPNIPKVKTYTKKTKKEILLKNSTEHEENIGPEWIDGEPQGVESFIVDGSDGSRRSIIVPDKRLPPGWQKHFTQRKAGTSAGKWDVLFIHKSSGKKFRSRNDIRSFMENQGQYDFDPERFDFCIHRKKRNSISRSKQEQSVEVPKKIKTLLPKSKTSFIAENTFLSTSPNPAILPVGTPPTAPAGDGAVFIGGLRVEMEDSAYKCPKKECNKNFRKENLLQMHIKHYHPEYSKFLGSTPNVADLAYARTIGESIDDIIPKKASTFLDRIGKFNKKKSIQDKSSSIGVSSNTNPTQQFPSLTLSAIADAEMDTLNTEGHNDPQKEDIKMETLSCVSNHSIEAEEETVKKQENVCAMSPGTLFDMKVKEEKTQSGIKTLLPVRPVITSETQRVDRSKSLDEAVQIDQVKGQRKRQLSEYSSDVSIKGKRRHGIQEYMDDYEDMDDSALDAEGPTRLMYRYSRRKSDSKSDENSRNSHLNDSHLDKGDPLKGDIAKRDNNDIEESEGVMMLINGEMIKVEQLRKEEIINCTCGFMEEDGLMIQCDLCLCWQHGHCNAIEREKDVPEKYVCYICRHPYRQRPSKKYFHDQDWIKEGKLLSLPNRAKNQDVMNTRTAMLKRSYDLVAALLQMQQILHSLRVKINVAQKKDHPKLYLWAKNWEKSEIPKPDVEPVPVFEIVKTEDVNSITEKFRRSEMKPELKDIAKDEPDDKSIDSDSELMKILEEDSTTSDESKGVSKKEDDDNHGESHILLNALTRSDDPYEQSKSITCSTEASEKTSHNVDEPLALENPTTTNARHKDKMQEESAILELRPEVSTPLQPFIPEPEAPIDLAECRMRLLEHIEHFQNHIDSRLTAIEAHVCTLENMDPDDVVLSSDVQPRTKQTVQMLLRDLNAVRKLAALC